jgi:hypothetical protein
MLSKDLVTSDMGAASKLIKVDGKQNRHTASPVHSKCDNPVDAFDFLFFLCNVHSSRFGFGGG